RVAGDGLEQRPGEAEHGAEDHGGHGPGQAPPDHEQLRGARRLPEQRLGDLRRRVDDLAEHERGERDRGGEREERGAREHRAHREPLGGPGGARQRRVQHEGAGEEAGAVHRRPAFLPRTTRRSTGAPMNAVTTPTGSSRSGRRTREATSARRMITGAASADIGMMRVWSLPTSRRQAWGTMSPMKPMGPATAVAAPTRSATARTVSVRTRRVSTPREAARSSPRAMALRGLRSRTARTSPAPM